MKKLQVWWPLLFSITLIAGMWFGYKLSSNIPKGQDFFSRNKKSSVQEVIDLLRQQYVDSIHVDSLNQQAIYAMLEKLDPHTVYIPLDLTAEANEDLEGNFQGIGVEYLIIKDTVNAVHILPLGPSEKAGLQIGDKLIKVGDSLVAGNSISNERIKKLLRGPENTNVRLTLLRDNKTIVKIITRGTIPKPAVDAAYMINDTTGFLHINKFSRTTYEEFMTAMEGLQKKGLKKLILDLRDNGGGLLDEAVDIADEFLSGEKLVLYTEGLHNQKREYLCKRPGLFEKGDLVVLINEFTASASEVLAGALQDWDRATIIGRRSFGKGLVQEPFELNDGSQLRLTVSRYYTPNGRNIQKPFQKDHESYEEEVFSRQINDSTLPLNKGKAYKTLVKKRIVYGGGGITPDLSIERSSDHLSRPLLDILHKNGLSEFVYNQFTSRKSFFKNFKSPEDFNKNYMVGNQEFQDLERMYGIKISAENSIENADRTYLAKQIKNQLGLQIFQTQGFYEVFNTNDATVQKAIQLKAGL